jgi:hypothetical protein
MPQEKTNFVAQITLILESVMVLLMGLLMGVLLPNSVTVQIRSILSRSLIYMDAQQAFYAAWVLSVFLIIHQYLCWMWLVKESKKRFVDTNRWGNIIFVYGCTALILFSVGVICLQTLMPK